MQCREWLPKLLKIFASVFFLCPFHMTRALEEALLQHFICQKLEIAYAINKPFPFLEGLRDNLFITEKLYRESLEACRNLVPVSRVVYNILTKLQTTFNLSFLELLFSQINLREYPNLMMTLQSFERVARDDSSEPSEPKELQEAAGTPSNKQGAASPGHGLQERLPEMDQATQRKVDSTRKSKVMTRVQEARTKCAQTPKPEEISDDISEIDEGKRPQEPPSGSPRITRSKERKRKIQSWSSSKKKQKKSLPRGAASPGHRVQEERQVMNQATQRSDDSTRNPYVMTRAQKARPECDQTPSLEEEKRGKVVCSSSTRCQRNVPAKEKPKEDSLDFHAPKLPVTCGKAKGILYKEKMKQGSSKKCIQNEKGVWFTPREFEMEGKRAQSKNWKRSVLCGGKSLEQLMKNGLLLCPPRSLKREGPHWDKESKFSSDYKWTNAGLSSSNVIQHITVALQYTRPPLAWASTSTPVRTVVGQAPGGWWKPHTVLQGLAVSVSLVLADPNGACIISPFEQEDPKECTVCCRGGLLLCCDTCPRAFHENCHIPTVEAERLIRDYGEPFKEAMWLNLVKERLAEKVYTVAWFLRDMRLIFRNHQAFYKASNFGQVGLDLEAEFEKDLKEVLVFHKANENSFQAPP
ncbi:Interferon-induced protein 75 [Camelus dromedarius]|uniref:Interferon-induced protein 75 n=1 Tax=Camelus dromedarius TaxID=9838 RepID=A0A5N4E883_CAMDR|nr:Interferon-induced protein 75 [Camelus dromedarius]